MRNINEIIKNSVLGSMSYRVDTDKLSSIEVEELFEDTTGKVISISRGKTVGCLNCAFYEGDNHLHLCSTFPCTNFIAIYLPDKNLSKFTAQKTVSIKDVSGKICNSDVCPYFSECYDENNGEYTAFNRSSFQCLLTIIFS